MPPVSPAVADPFAALPEPLQRLARRGERRRFRKGHRLIQEGDQGDTLFVILSGRVRVFGSDDKDREITYGT
ncbi:MAG TPA: cyclic nucleotide-binding domain-containing protein, partial [Burkholderiaceae bacterium]|nr:cyclic nucleotide-binding domain-containing protein [Burkholderiaceae bacterium]